jgi:hypothetical protein
VEAKACAGEVVDQDQHPQAAGGKAVRDQVVDQDPAAGDGTEQSETKSSDRH